MADLYSTLGVERSADAAAIKRAYRKLAKQLHPDQNKDNPAAADRFKQVTAAYDILSDAKKKAQYDAGEIDEQGNPRFAGFRPGAGGGNPFGGGRGRPSDFEFDFGRGGGGAEDLFSELFGRASGMGGGRGGFTPPPQKGADVAYRLRVPFADAALARSVRLSLRNGKTIELAIPKGVEEGRQVRLAGQGDPGPAGAGDAIVTITIQPDARFARDETNSNGDVRTDFNVPLETAVLGGKQRVPTPEGEVSLTIAPGTSSGKVMRLKGKGWTRRDGDRGDLLARVLVDIPADPELADFLRARQTA